MRREWMVLAGWFATTIPAQEGHLLHPEEALAVHRLLGLPQAFAHGPLGPRRTGLPAGIGSREAVGLRYQRHAIPADPAQPVTLDGYHFAYFNEGRSGAPIPYNQHAIRNRGGFCAYAWPQARGVRVFFLSAKGVLLTLAADVGYRGPTGPQGTAALAMGEAPVIASALDTPGRGQDGRVWGPVDPRWFGKWQLVVEDGEGVALTGFTIRVVADDPGQRRRTIPLGDEPMPLAEADPDRNGRCLLWGPRVRGARLGVFLGGRALGIDGATLHREGNGIRLVFPGGRLRDEVINNNESAVIATLRNISSAQAQCQACGVIDANGNGAGEYGFFAELCGAQPVRSDDKGGVGEKHIQPPVLSRAFGKIQQGRVVRRGYVFQMFLPDSEKQPVPEAAGGGGIGAKVDPAMAEVLWCAYAWPLEAGRTGKRAYFVNQSGDVLATRNEDDFHSGHGEPVDPMAAFIQGAEDGMAAPPAANAVGQNAARWVVIG